MSEANTLISPCKKLRLGADDDEGTFKHATASTNVDEAIGSHGKDSYIIGKGSEKCQLQKLPLIDDNSPSEVMSEVDAVNTAESEPTSSIYVDNATAMLANVIDSTDQFESLTAVQTDGECKVGLLFVDDEVDDGQYSSDSSVIGELDTLEDIQESLDVVNACKEEIDILIENRKTEVKTVCSSVDVSAIIKQMETIQNKKNSQEEEGLIEVSSKPDLITELDTSMTSESTDDLNSSSVTVTEDPCQKTDSCPVNEQDMELLNDSGITKTSDDNLDDTLHDDCQDEERHYEHVYANVVVVKSAEKKHKNYGSENNAEFNPLQINDERNNEAKNCLSLQNSEQSSILERTLGEGKECADDTSNYFCVVEANDGEALREEVNGNKGETEEFNGEETVTQPVNSGMVSLNMSRLQTMTHPICASTPLPQNYPDMSDVIENETGKLYANPQLVTNEHVKKQSNSEPLLTSTPVVKASQGLRMRDMNIMRGTEEKKHVKFTQKLETETDNEVYDDFLKENEKHSYEDLIAKNNEKNSRKEKLLSGGTLKRDRKSKREKKKLMGVRVEKFKEYMGPGLTSGMNSDNVSEAVVDSSSKNLVKASDIETCTLTEYKGFGLTGPLPDRPLQTSTPLPPQEDQVRHVDSGSKNDDHAHTLRRCLSGVSLGGKPAGTEGFLPDFLTKKHTDNTATVNSMKSSTGQKLRQTVSESKFGQKTNLVLGDLNIRTLTRHTSDLGPQSHNKQNRLTGWLASVQAQKIPLATLYEHGQQAETALLRPDEAYPSVTSVRGDNSEGNSNTDKSDKSEKMVIDPHVLQNSGMCNLLHK